jgi:uncharacterized cupin superfamily protein
MAMTKETNRFSVSDLETDAWEYDEETGGLVYMIRSDDTIQVGLWKPGVTAHRTIEVNLQADETLLVLAGTGRLHVDDDAPIDLRPGQIIALPKGARTRWVVNEAFRELWIYS